MKINEKKLKKKYGYEEGYADAIDPQTAAKALDYKKHFLKHFIAINQHQIEQRLGGQKYWVTLKYDGEFADIFHSGGQTFTLNRSARVRRGIPCIEEAGKLLEQAGIQDAVIPAEIYFYNGGKRAKLGPLLSAFADEKKIANLRLAVYDIQELEGKPFRSPDYRVTHAKITEIFGQGTLCHPVEMKEANSVQEVKNLFQKWVVGENQEGLVVRSEMPFVFKIKPRHTLDTVVIGFTEGTGSQKGQIRTMLLALMPEKNRYQIITHVGGGMKEEQKKKLFKAFSRKIIPSEYIETDSNYVAFHLIRPDTILEISVNDVNFEKPEYQIKNTVLEIRDGRYRLHSTVDGMSVVAPVIERLREDKEADETDVRVSQVEHFTFRDPAGEEEQVEQESADLPKSELLSREVYTKQQGTKIMVQKYVVWKTHKEASGHYPAYVFYYANFSSQRADPLQREIKVSSSREQILELKKQSLRENVKKGWEKVEPVKPEKK